MTVKVSKSAIDIRTELSELKKPSGVAGQELLKTNTLEQQQTLIGVNKVNHIINGDFQIWQRGTTGSAVNAFSMVSADRWYAVRNSLNRETDTYGNPYAHMVCGSFTDTNYINTRIENPRQFAGKTLTIQFYMKSDDGMGAGGQVYIRNYSTSNSWQVHLNKNFVYGNTWQKYAFTFHVPESTTFNTGDYGLDIFIYGNNLAVNYNNKSYDIKDVQLVEGDYPEGIEFIRRSEGEELALCQRYYYEHVRGVNGSRTYVGPGDFYTTTQLNLHISFPVTMRTTPTLVQGNGTNYFGWWGGSQNGDISSTWTLFLPNRNVTSLYVNPDNDPSSSGIGARIYIKDDSSVSGTTNAFLAFNAEL